MYAPVAAEFNKMYDAALAAGFKLKNVGDYRSFQGQLSMFMDRYVTTDTGTGVTRQYEGKTWWLKKGKAPSAAPDPTGLKGSNHGWGLAIDLGYDVNGKLTSMGGKCFEWMCANAPKYGFYLQGNNAASKEFEAWHWQYCIGDKQAPALSGAAPAPVAAAPVATPAPVPVEQQKAADPENDKVLSVGSKGPEVVELQKLLAKHKVYAGKADGDFGKVTEASVNKFKAAKGLKADGRAGAKVFALLRMK